jgi:SrtB family sortase
MYPKTPFGKINFYHEMFNNRNLVETPVAESTIKPLDNVSSPAQNQIVAETKTAKTGKKEKSKKKILAIIIPSIIILLLALGVGLSFFMGWLPLKKDYGNRTDFDLTLRELVTKMNSAREALPADYVRDEELDYTQFLAGTGDYKESKTPNNLTCRNYIYENHTSDKVVIIVRLVCDNPDNFDSTKAKVSSVIIKAPNGEYDNLSKKMIGLQAQVAIATDEDINFNDFQKEIEPFINDNLKLKTKSAYKRYKRNSYGEKMYDDRVTLHIWAGDSYFSYDGYDEPQIMGFDEIEREVKTFEPELKETKSTESTGYRGGSGEVRSALWSGNFADALATNSDVVGWLGVEGTNITGPVLQSTNNEYYLTRTIYKKYSRFGSRYVDYRCNVDPANQSQNITIYGHYSDEGIIFAKLHKFKDLNFFKEHAVIEFSTPNQLGFYKVFAVFIVNTMSVHGPVFEYRDPYYATEDDFLYFIKRVKRRSIIDTDVDIKGDDKILTLSTCTREFKQARLVVMARKLRPDESYYADTSNYKYNNNPLFPNVWYKSVKPSAKKPYYADEP